MGATVVSFFTLRKHVWIVLVGGMRPRSMGSRTGWQTSAVEFMTWNSGASESGVTHILSVREMERRTATTVVLPSNHGRYFSTPCLLIVHRNRIYSIYTVYIYPPNQHSTSILSYYRMVSQYHLLSVLSVVGSSYSSQEAHNRLTIRPYFRRIAWKIIRSYDPVTAMIHNNSYLAEER